MSVTLSELSRCLVITEEHALESADRVKVVALRDKFEARLRGFVQEGIEDGSIIPCDPKLAIFSIFGAVNWVPKWYSNDGSWSNKQLAKSMAQLLCRSIAKKPVDALDVDVGRITAGDQEDSQDASSLV